MIRCKIEMLPGGNETKAFIIGLVEITNIGGTRNVGNYAVVLKKTPPFKGALLNAWRQGFLTEDNVTSNFCDIEPGESSDIITSKVIGHHRIKRGVYDLLYRALQACGLENR